MQAAWAPCCPAGPPKESASCAAAWSLRLPEVGFQSVCSCNGWFVGTPCVGWLLCASAVYCACRVGVGRQMIAVKFVLSWAFTRQVQGVPTTSCTDVLWALCSPVFLSRVRGRQWATEQWRGLSSSAMLGRVPAAQCRLQGGGVVLELLSVGTWCEAFPENSQGLCWAHAPLARASLAGFV